MNQHLEELCNSVNQHFPSDMLQHCAWVKDLFKTQARPMDFTTADYEKFINVGPNFSLQ
jgi:hypothetical protein